MAEVLWCKVALCLPLTCMATKATKSVCQFRKAKVISVTKVFAMAEHYAKALPIGF